MMQDRVSPLPQGRLMMVTPQWNESLRRMSTINPQYLPGPTLLDEQTYLRLQDVEQLRFPPQQNPCMDENGFIHQSKVQFNPIYDENIINRYIRNNSNNYQINPPWVQYAVEPQQGYYDMYHPASSSTYPLEVQMSRMSLTAGRSNGLSSPERGLTRRGRKSWR